MAWGVFRLLDSWWRAQNFESRAERRQGGSQPGDDKIQKQEKVAVLSVALQNLRFADSDQTAQDAWLTISSELSNDAVNPP